MNASRLVVVSVALASLSACATRGPAPENESILDVLDRAEAAPAAHAPAANMSCPVGAVRYCEHDTGTVRCTCHDPSEVRAWLRQAYGGT